MRVRRNQLREGDDKQRDKHYGSCQAMSVRESGINSGEQSARARCDCKRTCRLLEATAYALATGTAIGARVALGGTLVETKEGWEGKGERTQRPQ